MPPSEANRMQTMEERIEDAEASYDEAINTLRLVAAQSNEVANKITELADLEEDDFDEDSLVVEMKTLQRRARSVSRSAIMLAAAPPDKDGGS